MKFVISLVVSLLILLSSSSLAQTVKPPFDVESAETPSEPFISRLQAPSPSSLLLRWQSVAPGVTGFRIYRDNQPIATVPAEMREYQDSGLRPATVYSYSVAALLGQEEFRSWPVSDITRVPNLATRESRARFEAVVAGATPGGIAAALTLARFGHKVVLVSPSPWLGGMMTGGLSRTDFGSTKSSGGFFKEFAERVYKYYVTTYGAASPQATASRNGYYFEPRVAKWVFHQMLAEQPNITVMLDHHTRDVVKDGNRVTAVYVLDRPRMIRKTLLAQVFIDATYEGDLAAQAGAAYRIGREGKSEFNEEHAGEIFWDPPKTRVVFGSGRGDRKVQAYNYRLSVTNDPANRYRFPAPTAYDRKPYVTLIPDIQSGRVKNLEQVMSILPLPNRKFDANNHPLGNPSTDLIGGSDTYPEADVWQREPLAEAHRQHILGLLYFVQNDPEVPAAFRLQARHWGFAFDEFVDNERFPTQLYVREGRRIIGQDIFTENDARSLSPERRPNFHPNSIAVADYPIDSHATSLEKNGLLEGFFYLPGTQTQPSQIPYGVMMPLGLEGVIVSGCVSSTHIGYGTLRMEPVFMALGTTAGTAAHLSLREGVTPSQLDSSHLQRLLLQQKQVICVFNDVPIDHPHWQALQYFGTKGFLPQYTAHPDASITRAEAAQWLWQWMQLHRSDLRPMLVDTRHYTDLKADAASFIAVHSLTWWKVLAGATGADGIAHTATATMFNPDEPLVTSVVDKWLSAATRVLGRRTATDYHRTPSPEGIMTRGGFLQRLYETESLVKGPSTISRR